MSPVRKLRYAVIGLNLMMVGAIGVAAHALVRGPRHDEIGEHDPTLYALEDRVQATRDLSVIAAALDRPLLKAPPPPPAEAPTPTLSAPPSLTLVALLPDEADDRDNFAIVSQHGVQRLLKPGDVIQEGPEQWRVAAVRLEPLGEGTLGKLTLETERRVHTYEARFRPGG